MLLAYLLFFFVALGAKFVLALITIFLLLPSDRRCSQCDTETLLVRPNRAGRLAFRCSLGRVQWRWCPGCGWEGLARRGRPTYPETIRVDSSAPTPRS